MSKNEAVFYRIDGKEYMRTGSVVSTRDNPHLPLPGGEVPTPDNVGKLIENVKGVPAEVKERLEKSGYAEIAPTRRPGERGNLFDEIVFQNGPLVWAGKIWETPAVLARGMLEKAVDNDSVLFALRDRAVEFLAEYDSVPVDDARVLEVARLVRGFVDPDDLPCVLKGEVSKRNPMAHPVMDFGDPPQHVVYDCTETAAHILRCNDGMAIEDIVGHMLDMGLVDPDPHLRTVWHGVASEVDRLSMAVERIDERQRNEPTVKFERSVPCRDPIEVMTDPSHVPGRSKDDPPRAVYKQYRVTREELADMFPGRDVPQRDVDRSAPGDDFHFPDMPSGRLHEIAEADEYNKAWVERLEKVTARAVEPVVDRMKKWNEARPECKETVEAMTGDTAEKSAPLQRHRRLELRVIEGEDDEQRARDFVEGLPDGPADPWEDGDILFDEWADREAGPDSGGWHPIQNTPEENMTARYRAHLRFHSMTMDEDKPWVWEKGQAFIDYRPRSSEPIVETDEKALGEFFERLDALDDDLYK